MPSLSPQRGCAIALDTGGSGRTWSAKTGRVTRIMFPVDYQQCTAHNTEAGEDCTVDAIDVLASSRIGPDFAKWGCLPRATMPDSIVPPA